MPTFSRLLVPTFCYVPISCKLCLFVPISTDVPTFSKVCHFVPTFTDLPTTLSLVIQCDQKKGSSFMVEA